MDCFKLLKIIHTDRTGNEFIPLLRTPVVTIGNTARRLVLIVDTSGQHLFATFDEDLHAYRSGTVVLESISGVLFWS